MRLTALPVCLAAAALLAGCGSDLPEPAFIAQGNPPLLSDWGQVAISGDTLVLGERVVAYDLNTPLFTDYAHKLRTIWMPDGTQATYREGDTLDFPVGTVISKTFYYPLAGERGSGEVVRTDAANGDFDGEALDLNQVQLVETRLLVHRENGWVALPYRWNDDQTEARLHRIGDIVPLTLVAEDGSREAFNYVMPDTNQCASCHAPDSNTRAIAPIGPKPRHLNRDFLYAHGVQNQLDYLVETGFLASAPAAAAAPAIANWTDLSASTEDRARAYLDINCSHCHSAVGPADTSGLDLEPHVPHGPALGLCKLPIAAGAGTGDRLYDIVPGHPDQSILVYRLDNVQPDEMMPELGRSTVHTAGVALITDWIEGLAGDCG